AAAGVVAVVDPRSVRPAQRQDPAGRVELPDPALPVPLLEGQIVARVGVAAPLRPLARAVPGGQAAALVALERLGGAVAPAARAGPPLQVVLDLARERLAAGRPRLERDQAGPARLPPAAERALDAEAVALAPDPQQRRPAFEADLGLPVGA